MSNIGNCHKWPAVARDAFQVANGGQPPLPPVLQNNEATPPGAKKILFSKIQQIDIAIDGEPITRHHIAGSDMREGSRDLDTRLARRCGLRHEPPDECEPQPPKGACEEESEESEDNESGCNDLSHNRDNLGCTDKIVTNSPNDGPKHAPAVQGIPGNHIEQSKRYIDVAQPYQACPQGGGRSPGLRLPAGGTSNSQAEQADHDARNRPCHCHPEFGGGVGRFLFDIRDTAEGK